MHSPLACPPVGLCVPMEFVRARDTDTIECRLRGSALVWAIRLIHVWAPEIHGGSRQSRELADRGKRFVAGLCAAAETLHVFVPFVGREQPLKMFTFDRVPAFVFLPSGSLNERIVSEGFASSTQGGVIGS